jgi:hypothetical protein
LCFNYRYHIAELFHQIENQNAKSAEVLYQLVLYGNSDFLLIRTRCGPAASEGPKSKALPSPTSLSAQVGETG